MKARTFLLIGVVGALAAGAYGWMEYNRTADDAGAMKEVLSVSALQLHADFLADESAANAKYVGTSEQAIKVKGVIRSVEPADKGSMNVILETADQMAGVVCEFAPDAMPSAWKAGDEVVLNGICTGVNDLIPDVILVRCAAVE